MADIIRSEKPLAVSPIKTGQPLGAILASLGLAQAIPLVHGAQGCSAFAKVFFIQHFHDPVPLQSTAMDPTATIMGADGNIFRAAISPGWCASFVRRIRAITAWRSSPSIPRIFLALWKTATAR